MQNPSPQRPRQLDPLALELLEGLAGHAAARAFVLGGYFALKHYWDYRPTHDVDAWWDSAASTPEREAARAALRQVLSDIAGRRGLTVAGRRFGDTESWALNQAGKTLFTFQISTRTVQLEPYQPSPWPPLQIETLADNVGSKMNALVQRGAPRDFLDVKALVTAGLVTPAECWALWERKNPDLTLGAAHLEVGRHLEALELRRPLSSIPDASERERAQATRGWFRAQFLRSSPDATGS